MIYRSGKLCDTWDTSVPFDSLLEELLELAQQSSTPRPDPPRPNAKRDPTPPAPPKPKLPTSLGYGVDISTGDQKLPILALQYTDPNSIYKTSTGDIMLVADGTSVKAHSTFGVGYGHQI